MCSGYEGRQSGVSVYLIRAPCSFGQLQIIVEMCCPQILDVAEKGARAQSAVTIVWTVVRLL